MNIMPPSAQLKADMKKVGDTMLKEWLDKAGAEGKALVDAYPKVRRPGTDAPSCSTRFYDGAAALAALFMVGLLVMVLLSIVEPAAALLRAGHRCLRRLPDGRQRLPGAGPHAQARRAHPRDAAGQCAEGPLAKGSRNLGARRWRRCWPLLFAYYSCRLAWQSHAFNDISTGNDATPLWIPQLAMAVGTIVLAIAFIDELVLEAARPARTAGRRRGAAQRMR